MSGEFNVWHHAMVEHAGQRLLGRRFWNCAFLLTLTLSLAACASTRTPVERLVADAGVRATQVLANDADTFARRLEEGDATSAFVATWRACDADAARCAIAEPSATHQSQREELAGAVALRVEAIAALNRAYAAFRIDVAEQSGVRAERAVREAVVGTVSYATSLTGLPLNGTAGLGRPLERAAGVMASAVAVQQRQSEMRDASAALGEAIANLREAMMLETRKYDASTEVLVGERVEAHRALLQAGLVSGGATLRPVADWLDVPLARDADTIIARSVPARTAVEAMVEASERLEVRRTQRRYRAAIVALGELEQVHAQMSVGRRPDVSRLDQALWNLERLADPLAPAARATGAPSPAANETQASR